MLCKIALRNIRRAIGDYAVYFITLVVGVALFYAFNAIGEQAVLFDFKQQASERIFDLAEAGLGMFTYLVIAVLAFLVVYANRFLIRRRKKEFGTYLLLGMKPHQVSFIILLEAVVVGVASLAVGLALGFLLSQASCFLTAQLIDMPIQEYTFVFSLEGLESTAVCFAAIFVIVALLNVITIRRCKVVDLLYGSDRNERAGLKWLWPRLVVLPVSIVCIARAYQLFDEVGILGIDTPEFAWSTALMIVGTFLFFWSAAGFAVIAIRRARGVYFRKLTMFTTSQVASRMNTAFASLSVICVMLFFSLTVFACGNGLTSLFAGDVEKTVPFEASISSFAKGASNSQNTVRAQEWDWDMAAYFAAESPSWDGLVERSVQVDVFQDIPDSDTYLNVADALGGAAILSVDGEDNSSLEQWGTEKIAVVSESQMNGILELAGQEPIQLGTDEFAIDNTMEMTQQFAQTVAESDVTVKVFGRELIPSGDAISLELQTAAMASTALVMVVPDDLVAQLWDAGEMPSTSALNLDLTVDREDAEDALLTIFSEAFPGDVDEEGVRGYDTQGMVWPLATYITAWEMIVQAGGMRLMFTYMALYVGLVFLIITAVMLAIQQLSSASDSASRYGMLARLGCDGRMLFRSLRSQVLVYFLAPLAVAVCHTICAVHVVNKSLFAALGDARLLDSVLMTVALTVAIYGVYLLITYFGSKAMVRAGVGRRLLGE